MEIHFGVRNDDEEIKLSGKTELKTSWLGDPFVHNRAHSVDYSLQHFLL